MSVLKNRRSESKAEFLNTANEIYTRTLAFLSRLSARYSRLLAADTIRLASEVIDHTEKANSIFPSSDARKELREKHLLEARGALMALDVKLLHCYSVLTQNPSGCFETASGKPLGASDAIAKLDSMAQTLGELVDKENALLSSLIKSSKHS